MTHEPGTPHSPRREACCADYQITDKWRITAVHEHQLQPAPAYGTTGCNGSDQLPLPYRTACEQELHAVDDRSPQRSTSLEASWGRAANSLNYDIPLDSLYPCQFGTAACVLVPDAVQGDYVRNPVPRRPHVMPGSYHTDRGRSPTKHPHTLLANITKVGIANSKAGIYYQTATSRRASSRASTAASTSPTTQQSIRHGVRVRQRRTGVFNPTRKPTSSPSRSGGTRTSSIRAGQLARRQRLTSTTGPLLHLSHSGTTPSRVQFLPDHFTPRSVLSCIAGVSHAYPCGGNDRRGWIPADRVRRGTTTANTVEGPFIGRLTPTDRFNGAFQAGQGINPAAGRPRPSVSRRASASSTTSPVRRDHPARRLGHLLRPPAGHMVFDMIAMRRAC